MKMVLIGYALSKNMIIYITMIHLELLCLKMNMIYLYKNMIIYIIILDKNKI